MVEQSVLYGVVLSCLLALAGVAYRWYRYRSVVTTPVELISLGIEKRCYLDPHLTHFFVGGKKIGPLTSFFVQRDFNWLIAHGYIAIQRYCDRKGEEVDVTEEMLEKFQKDMANLYRFSEGRPEKHPDFPSICPYRYTSFMFS
jgi:hypothetical protein